MKLHFLDCLMRLSIKNEFWLDTIDEKEESILKSPLVEFIPLSFCVMKLKIYK